MIQFKFNLDTRIKIYSFLSSKLSFMWDDIASFVFFACMHRLFFILNDCSGSNLHLDYWTGSQLTRKIFLGVMDVPTIAMYNRSLAQNPRDQMAGDAGEVVSYIELAPCG